MAVNTTASFLPLKIKLMSTPGRPGGAAAAWGQFWMSGGSDRENRQQQQSEQVQTLMEQGDCSDLAQWVLIVHLFSSLPQQACPRIFVSFVRGPAKQGPPMGSGPKAGEGRSKNDQRTFSGASFVNTVSLVMSIDVVVAISRGVPFSPF